MNVKVSFAEDRIWDIGDGELREWLADTLSVQRLKNRGLFEPAAVQRLIRDNESGQVDAAYTLFSLACIEIWCQRFLDRQTVSTPN